MNLEELLPLLQGVKEDLYYKINETVYPSKYLQWQAAYNGWLASALMLTDSPYTELSHDIFVRPVAYSPYTLNLYGGTQQIIGLNWVAKYDAVNNIYVIMYVPRPYKSYRKGQYIRVTNPLAAANIIVGVLLIQFIDIIDEELFRKSLKEVLGTERLMEVVR